MKGSLLFLLLLSTLYIDAILVKARDISVMNSTRPIKTLPGDGYEVHVINSLPNNNWPLLIHCASKNNELGNHVLHQKEGFHWSFKMNIGFSTMFFCRFRWGQKNQAYEVFNKNLAPYCEPYKEKRSGNLCVWSVKEDGFWISNQIPPLTLTQIYVW